VRSELPTGRDTMFVVTADRLSDEERRERSARQPDPLVAAAPELARKIAPDTERIVAHVERERANERMQTVSDLPAKMARRTPGPSAPDEAAIITIDGKLASEGQLAALEERDIASIAVYKGKEALLNLISNGKEHLEVTSDPAARTRVMQSNALIAVTTKMARAAHPKSP
jgi:hypothetical protein